MKPKTGTSPAGGELKIKPKTDDFPREGIKMKGIPGALPQEGSEI